MVTDASNQFTQQKAGIFKYDDEHEFENTSRTPENVDLLAAAMHDAVDSREKAKAMIENLMRNGPGGLGTDRKSCGGVQTMAHKFLLERERALHNNHQHV